MSTRIHHIPNRLRYYRKKSKKTQREVASLLGLRDATMVSRWEKGRCLPSALNLFRLSAVYRRQVDALYWEFIVMVRRELMGPDEPPGIRPFKQ